MNTVILINVGTPDSPQPEDVGRYLREFLMDPFILPLPRPFRDILVKGLIVPKRKFSSAEKYRSIWTDQGSPLMVESKRLCENLQSALGTHWRVRLGMQVGNPSLKKAMVEAAAESKKIFVVPLYPQYATATTGGALHAVRSSSKVEVPVHIVDPFYRQDWFLKAQADRIRSALKPQDHLLLSYHGLPVSQLKEHRPGCYQPGCCESQSACLQNCYKAQCLHTSALLKKELGLRDISIGFQSRLGRGQWIEPATIEVTKELARKGIRHLKVACPSFVADCLETLEEIGLELRHEFLASGGESFELIPCVNSHEIFVRGLAQLIESPQISKPQHP